MGSMFKNSIKIKINDLIEMFYHMIAFESNMKEEGRNVTVN